MHADLEQLVAFLTDTKLVSKEDIEKAKSEATEKNKPLAEILVSEGKISEDDFRRVNAYLLGIPFVDLKNEKIDKKILSLIPEPIARNTAPAVLCAALYLKRSLGPGRRALVLTSDHVIGPIDAFRADVEAADSLAAQSKFVVFGIPPHGPETGFGYIEAGEPVSAGGHAAGRTFLVASFREKPDRATAEKFLASGRFTWNSGMFGFDCDFLIEEFRAHSPDTLASFGKLEKPTEDAYEKAQGVSLLSRWKGMDDAYRAVKGISIDYAIAEKCRSVAVVATSFDWVDIGSWDEYARFIEKGSAQGSKVKAPVFSSASPGCWVDSDLPVALCGVEDLIVVVRSGADGSPPSVLVCKRGESQRVKDAVEAIKAAGRTDLL